jgi:hypothetical protein
MKSASPVVLFLSVFLAMIFAGGLLLLGWQYSIREHSPKPFTLPTSTSSESAAPILASKGVLEGEVFIVTKGGQNYKLGLVPVALYSLDTLKPYIDDKTKEGSAELSRLKPLIDAAKAEMDRKDAAEHSAFKATVDDYSDPTRSALEVAYTRAVHQYAVAQGAYYALLGDRDKVLSADFYFAELPQPIVTTQTDSDGRFKIELPTKGRFVVAASAQRSVGESVEHYHWLLKVSLDGSSIKTVMLSNNNLSSEGSPDSLIPTAEEAMLATTPSAVSDTQTPTTSAASATQTPAPEFVMITKSTEARIPETFEMIPLKPGERLRFVSLAGDQVRVQYGKFQAVVALSATDFNETKR